MSASAIKGLYFSENERSQTVPVNSEGYAKMINDFEIKTSHTYCECVHKCSAAVIFSKKYLETAPRSTDLSP